MDRTEEMKEMIQREIQNIRKLEERVAFRELMEGVFLPLYETNQRMYEDLEDRIQEELSCDVNRCLIRTGLVEKGYVDVSHHLMTPMLSEDLEERSCSIKELKEALVEKGGFPLMTVLLQCDYLDIQELWSKDPEFQGTLKTEQPDRTWKIRVRLRRNITYLDEVAKLYKLFLKNGIPWQTVNAPYLYKMADVMLTGLEEGLTGQEKIQKIEIQFGTWSSVIRYDPVPVWNVRRLSLNSIGFPAPCEDHRNYEHVISIQEYGVQNAYLAEDDSELVSVVQRGAKIHIVSSAKEAKKWKVHMIQNGTDSRIDRYAWPVMENRRAESFSERYQRKWGQNIRTKAELARFIGGFHMDPYVKYQDCEVLDQFPERPQTYSMNPFVEDEIRDTGAQKKLLLYFEPGAQEAWLQRDIASFLVSEVQRLYPEYECGGKLL